MGERVSDIVVGSMMAFFGLLGLVMAANARDTEIYIFGMGLAVFGSAFLFGLVRRFYDEQDAAKSVRVAARREARHG